MYPLIRHGDVCRFEYVRQLSELKQGDVVLYARSGRLVGHRLIDVEAADEHVYLHCKGDANLFTDEVISPGQVLAKLVHIRKPRASIRMASGPARAVGFLAMRMPAYSKCMRWYLSRGGIRGIISGRKVDS